MISIDVYLIQLSMHDRASLLMSTGGQASSQLTPSHVDTPSSFSELSSHAKSWD